MNSKSYNEKKTKLKHHILSKRRLWFNKAIIIIIACILGTGLLLIAIEAIIIGVIQSPSDYRYDGDTYYFAINPIRFIFCLAFYISSAAFSFSIPIAYMDLIFPEQKDNSDKFKNPKKNQKKLRREQLKKPKNLNKKYALFHVEIIIQAKTRKYRKVINPDTQLLLVSEYSFQSFRIYNLQ